MNSTEVYRHRYIKTKCEKSLSFFIQYVFTEYYKKKWVHNWHHDEIIKLIYALERREIPNAVLNMPPRYGKTEIAVILWVCWTFIRNPKAQFIHGSYSVDLALKNSDQIRNILKSPCVQKYWPLKMRDSADSKGLWLTDENGGFKADSTAGAVVGFGAGILGWEDGMPFDGAIILDDPLKPKDASSELMRASINDGLSSTFHSRRNHKKVPIVIVMQRLHVDDPSGVAVNGGIMGDEFYHMKLAALSDDNKPLWKEKHDVDQLVQMREAKPGTFAGQYQQEPYIPKGEVYNLTWCARFKTAPVPPDRIMRVHSWDTAYKPAQHNDPSVCGIWDVTKNNYYRVDEEHGKWEYPELRKRAFELAERDKPDAILIEDKASGQSLIQEFRKFTKHPVIAIKPEGDKETRARTTAAIMEAGNVLVPEVAPWLCEWEAEITAFPKGRHDDRVDEMSQFLGYMREHGGNSFEDVLDAMGY